MSTAHLPATSIMPRPPWAATAAALVSFAALHLTGSGFVLLPLLALALPVAHLFEARLENSSATVRMARLVVVGLAAAMAVSRLRSDNIQSPEMVFAHAVGQLCAMEMALQYWLRRPTGGPRGPIVVLLSGLVMVAASNTFDERFVRFLVPVYIFFLMLSLREFAESPATLTGLPQRRNILRWLVTLLVLAGGAGLHFVVWTYRGEITQLGMKLLGENRAPETIGLSTTPRLSASFDVQGSLGRVLRAEGLPGHTYLRAMAFDEYSGGQWKPAVENRDYAPAKAEQLWPVALRRIAIDRVALDRAAMGRKARVQRLIDDAGLLFTPLNIAGLAAPAGSEVEWARATGGPLRSIDPAPDPYEYFLLFDNEPLHQGPLCVPLSNGVRARCLNVPPEIDNRVRALARRIGGHISDPQERVQAVQEYLMSHHAYSLTIQPGRGDPVSNFLLSDKSAHCEYFASAATILLRCLDVPARYVVGYLAHEPDGPGATVVRGRDAHAWAELWVEGTGWITIDATPGGGRPEARAEPLPFWLTVRESAQRLIMLVRHGLAHLGRVNGVLFLCIASALLACLMGWKLLHVRRPLAPTTFAYVLPAADLVDLMARFERCLSRRGVACPPQRTWHEQLDHEQLNRERFNLAPVQWSDNAGRKLSENDLSRAKTFLESYNAVRFGSLDDAAAIEKLRELLSVLER